MFKAKLFSKVGVSVLVACCGLIGSNVVAQDLQSDFDKMPIGDFVRVVAVEPIIFGDPDCKIANPMFCFGPAVAAVSLEFPGEWLIPNTVSTSVRGLASNLIESSPFLSARIKKKKLKPISNELAVKQNVAAPKQVLVETEYKDAAMSTTHDNGFNLKISINGSSTSKTLPTAQAQDKKNVPQFKFQKSYAFLK